MASPWVKYPHSLILALTYTVSQKRQSYIFLNNANENQPILMISGTRDVGEISRQ